MNIKRKAHTEIISMKIIVIARTRNEELNIERFCSSYTWADKILVADGGSDDKTKELASKFSNVEIRDFTEKVWKNKTSRNPHGKHINFLIRWAEDEGADWIIFDDVDCVPNYLIKQDHRQIFEDVEDSGAEFILANRVYIYGTNRYFEKLTCPAVVKGKYENKWIPSLWAWKANKGFAATEIDPFKHEFNKKPSESPRKELYPPYCLLHYFYPTDVYMKLKLAFYRSIYTPNILDPINFGGRLLAMEEWMKQ